MSIIELQEKHPDFIIHQHDPLNGNAPLLFLAQEFITPNDLFFVRNHGNIPAIDPLAYRLTVDGMISKPLTLTLKEILDNFPKVEVTATMQCAGNRRMELAEVASIPGEILWGAGAISTAKWGGVRLRDVLIAAGFDRKAQHVAFTGLDHVERLEQTFGFGGSISTQKALMPETILAYEMNGQRLSPAHGFPLRVVVPGYIGARSVKWLSQITVQTEPSANYFQQRAYKLFPTDVNLDNVDWSQGIMLAENSLNAVICYPSVSDEVPVGKLSVLGYAVGDRHNTVERVEVSADNGIRWEKATFLTGSADAWTWRLWEAVVNITPETTRIMARATDNAGNSQPRDTQEIWNFKGYSNNAWHRVSVSAVQS